MILFLLHYTIYLCIFNVKLCSKLNFAGFFNFDNIFNFFIESFLTLCIVWENFIYRPTTNHCLSNNIRQLQRIVTVQVKYTNLQQVNSANLAKIPLRYLEPFLLLVFFSLEEYLCSKVKITAEYLNLCPTFI